MVACPGTPALGTLAVLRGGALHVVDLSRCRDRVVSRGGVHGTVRFVRGRFVVSPVRPELVSRDGRAVATVRATKRRQTIVVRRGGAAHDVLSVSEVYRVVNDAQGPIWLLSWSPDARWLLYTIDPDSSGSIAADGLRVRAVRAAAGAKPVGVATMLAYRDYLGWCGGRLVLTAGGDRVATWNKRLAVAAPPAWRARTLVPARGRAWGSLACAPDGRSVVVQSQRASNDANFFAPRWSLWRVSLRGTMRRLTAPPPGYADESPRWSRDGRTLLFVRSRQGHGLLYAWRGGRVLGPLASLGYDTGYYGHHDWWSRAAWSRG